MVFALAATTFFAFRVSVAHGWTAVGMFGLVVAFVCFALLLSFGLSMRDRGRRSPPIAR
jgi:hypothetical protein